MATGEKIPMVFFPRFTTITGSLTLETTPIDMLGFGAARMTFWRGETTGGSSPVVNFKVEQSADLTKWAELLAVTDPGQDGTALEHIVPTQRYIRGTVTMSDNSTCTIWAVGYGERTE